MCDNCNSSCPCLEEHRGLQTEVALQKAGWRLLQWEEMREWPFHLQGMGEKKEMDEYSQWTIRYLTYNNWLIDFQFADRSTVEPDDRGCISYKQNFVIAKLPT